MPICSSIFLTSPLPVRMTLINAKYSLQHVGQQFHSCGFRWVRAAFYATTGVMVTFAIISTGREDVKMSNLFMRMMCEARV